MMGIDSRNSNVLLEEIEAKIADFTGTRFAVLCSSARTAIRLSLLALDIGHGNEVVIPDFACQILPITAFCVGATPKFCDVGKEDLAISPDHLETAITPNTRAVIFIHMYGIPVDPSRALEIAHDKGVAFIEDAAQALGASLNGRKVGSFGDLGIFTFNKLLGVNLGGAVTTNDRGLADKIKALKKKYERKSILLSSAYALTASLSPKSRVFNKIIFSGSNQLKALTSISLAKKHFREINGWVVPGSHVLKLWQQEALSPQIVNQLMTYAGRYWHAREMDKYEAIQLASEFEKTEDFVQDHERIAGMYKELLGEGHFSAIDVKAGSKPSYMRYPILLDDSRKLTKCIEELERANFEVDYRYKPLHSSPFFSLTSPDGKFDGSTYIYQHILPLPIHRCMDAREVRTVASIVKTASSS